jgi:hypothetical protein
MRSLKIVSGFARKDKANISDDDLVALRELAAIMQANNEAELGLAIENLFGLNSVPCFWANESTSTNPPHT